MMKFSFQSLRISSKFTPQKISYRFFEELIFNKRETEINEENIRNKLKEFSLPYKDGHTCFCVNECRFCSQTSGAPKDKVNIFINKKTGFLVCENCSIIGNWASYENFLDKKTYDNHNLSEYKNEWKRIDKNLPEWENLVKKTKPVAKLNEDSFKAVFKNFNLTPFSNAVAEKLKLRINTEEDILYFPVLCSKSVVGYMTYHKNGYSDTFPKNDCPGLLMKSVKSKSAIVVSRIPDFVALLSKSTKNDLICLVYGTKKLPQSVLPLFENFNKITLWLGKENFDSIGNIAIKLCEKRCYILKPVGNYVNAETAVLKSEDIDKALNQAKFAYNEFVTTFSSFRDQILSELQNPDLINGVPWKRFPELTDILGGHRRGELTILSGLTGVGKTTFASEYSLDLAMQGVNTLWGSFEIKNIRLLRTMLTQFAGVPLDQNLTTFNDICDKFEEIPLFFLTLQGQPKFSIVMNAIEQCSYTYDIGHVIIDNIQFMIEVHANNLNFDRIVIQDALIQSFRKFASKFNCHVTLIMHPRKLMDESDVRMNSIFGGAKATQEADNVLILQKSFNSNYGIQKYLEVCKNRFSGNVGSFPLNFDKSSLSFCTKNEWQPELHDNNNNFKFKQMTACQQFSNNFEDEDYDTDSTSTNEKKPFSFFNSS